MSLRCNLLVMRNLFVFVFSLYIYIFYISIAPSSFGGRWISSFIFLFSFIFRALSPPIRSIFAIDCKSNPPHLTKKKRTDHSYILYSERERRWHDYYYPGSFPTWMVTLLSVFSVSTYSLILNPYIIFKSVVHKSSNHPTTHGLFPFCPPGSNSAARLDRSFPIGFWYLPTAWPLQKQ